MKCILVIGCPGAGKNTFARVLRDRTGLPLWYLDQIWHRPDRAAPGRCVDHRRQLPAHPGIPAAGIPGSMRKGEGSPLSFLLRHLDDCAKKSVRQLPGGLFVIHRESYSSTYLAL